MIKFCGLYDKFPNFILKHDSTFILRKEILESKTLNLFYGFENREGIFNDVDSRYKFALMQVSNATAPKNHTIKTMFYKTNIDEIYKRENVIRLNLAQIRALSPTHLALQEVRSKRDLEILGKAYSAFAPLDCCYLDFRRELDMTNDKDLFIEADCLYCHTDTPLRHTERSEVSKNTLRHTDPTLCHTDTPLRHTEGEARSISNTKQQERYFANAQYDKENSPSLSRGDSTDSPSLAEGARGWVSLRGSGEATTKQSKKIDCHEFDKSNSRNDAQFLPLFEGKMIHQFNAEFSAPNYFLDKDAFDNRLKSKEIYRLKQDLGIDSKQYSKLLESLYKSACHTDTPLRHTERSEVSKPRESNKNNESRIERRINKTDSALQHCDSISSDLDSSVASLPQNDREKSPPPLRRGFGGGYATNSCHL
ncbi:hypothetical protein [Helicobacter sp. T3_23-1056]